MRNLFIIILTLSFFNTSCQVKDPSLIIALSSNVTIVLETKDSINFSYKTEKNETFLKTINTNSNESDNLFENPKTNCLEIIFCNGTYGDNKTRTFLFIKNWYKFPIEYSAEIITSGNTKFEKTSVMPLFPNALSREDWPDKIEEIKLSNFKKMTFPEKPITETIENSPQLKYIGTEKSDSAFASLITIIKTKFADLTLNQVNSIEQKMKSQDITPNDYIELGTSIYPNKRKYKLETPKTYSRIEDSMFTNQIEYYYTKNDGSIKVIIFEWNNTIQNKIESFSFEENTDDKANKFQNKFNKIENFITSQIGQPQKRNIESLKNKDSYRDDIIWKSENGLDAYMFMFGNSNGYRQIRLAIYKE